MVGYRGNLFGKSCFFKYKEWFFSRILKEILADYDHDYAFKMKIHTVQFNKNVDKDLTFKISFNVLLMPKFPLNNILYYILVHFVNWKKKKRKWIPTIHQFSLFKSKLRLVSGECWVGVECCLNLEFSHQKTFIISKCTFLFFSSYSFFYFFTLLLLFRHHHVLLLHVRLSWYSFQFGIFVRAGRISEWM